MSEMKLTKAEEHEGRALERIKLGVLVGAALVFYVGVIFGNRGRGK
jgi:hypothetical protein